MSASLRPSIAGGRTRYSGAIYTGRQQSSESLAIKERRLSRPFNPLRTINVINRSARALRRLANDSCYICLLVYVCTQHCLEDL